MKKLLLLLSILIFTFSCKKESENSTLTGSISVSVLFLGQTIPEAEISTEPPTITATTNIDGIAILNDIPIGEYRVNAVHPQISSNYIYTTVTANQKVDVSISLLANLFELPNIEIEQPIEQSVHNLGENIEFRAFVYDSDDSPPMIDTEWSSNLDGIFYTGSPDNHGIVSFSANTLSEGHHIITVKATDSNTLENSTQLRIKIKRPPSPVTLLNIVSYQKGLNLIWSRSEETEFSSYQIYRSRKPESDFEIVSIINDVNQNSYTDEGLTFGIRYYYKIGVLNHLGDETISDSKSEIYEGENIDIATEIERMMMDPIRPYIYALDKTNNSLLFINKETKSLKKTISVGVAPMDMDINLDNDKMYIVSHDSPYVTVVDLDSQEKERDILVDINAGAGGAGNPHRVACMANNKLVFTIENNWNHMKFVDANTGSTLDTIGPIRQSGLTTSPDKTILYATQSGTTGSKTIRFDLEGDQLVEKDESIGSTNFSVRDAPISRDGTYLFYNKAKLPANNLQSKLGSFQEFIHACNFDGTIAIGERYIWDAENFSIIKPLPFSSQIMTLDANGEILYVYSTDLSKIAIIEIE